MKRYVAILFVGTVLFPQFALARTLSGLEIRVVKNEKALAKPCDHKVNNKTTIEGCFDPNKDRVWIRADVSASDFAFTLQHEIAHYHMENIQDKDLLLFVKKEREGNKWRDAEEVAADHFSVWVFSPTEVSSQERVFFERLVAKK